MGDSGRHSLFAAFVRLSTGEGNSRRAIGAPVKR